MMEEFHLFYAGTLDSRKGGAAAAISVATKLNSDYHIHILEFGNEEEKHRIQTNITELSKKYDCKVTYDGLLSGEEYIKFIQRCDIGLSHRIQQLNLMIHHFRQKYYHIWQMVLRVVSALIPVIECSAINKYMSYYSKQEPQEIVKAIKRINLSELYDSRKWYMTIWISQFQKDIKQLLEKVV